MSLSSVPIGEAMPDVVNAVIEIPKGTRNKYEYDEALDVLVLDRVVHSSVIYPVNYGFIPQTRAEDGDHLDVLVIGHDGLIPGSVVAVRPIGILRMTDDKGLDLKIIGAIAKDPKADHLTDIGDVNEAFREEIRNFFMVYKQLEGKSVTVEGYGTAEEAKQAIRDRLTK